MVSTTHRSRRFFVLVDVVSLYVCAANLILILSNQPLPFFSEVILALPRGAAVPRQLALGLTVLSLLSLLLSSLIPCSMLACMAHGSADDDTPCVGTVAKQLLRFGMLIALAVSVCHSVLALGFCFVFGAMIEQNDAVSAGDVFLLSTIFWMFLWQSVNNMLFVIDFVAVGLGGVLDMWSYPATQANAAVPLVVSQSTGSSCCCLVFEFVPIATALGRVYTNAAQGNASNEEVELARTRLINARHEAQRAGVCDGLTEEEIEALVTIKRKVPSTKTTTHKKKVQTKRISPKYAHSHSVQQPLVRREVKSSNSSIFIETKQQQGNNKSHTLVEDEPDNCVICLESLDRRTQVELPVCGHTLHRACSKRWLRRRNSCPLCRTPVVARPDMQQDPES
jgi:hypothetical protein